MSFLCSSFCASRYLLPSVESCAFSVAACVPPSHAPSFCFAVTAAATRRKKLVLNVLTEREITLPGFPSTPFGLLGIGEVGFFLKFFLKEKSVSAAAGEGCEGGDREKKSFFSLLSLPCGASE